MRSLKNYDNDQIIAFRIAPDLLKAFNEWCVKNDETRSHLIRALIKQHLEDHDAR
jgi:metal-responsive CopG/Arc/MetJ family transcriptional regulator